MNHLYIVSDLHVGRGRDPWSGAWDESELFFADEVFEQFSSWLATRSNGQEICTLLLLGDTFDLAEAASVPGDIGCLERETIAKLRRIAAGHPRFFTALTALLRAGVRIAVVPGNHDLELATPAAQETLRTLLTGDNPELDVRVSFHPWIYYIPGVVYAEHGSQYHDINALTTVVRPWAEGKSGPLERPLARLLERYHGDRGKGIAPVSRHWRLATGLARELWRLSARKTAERRSSYRAEVLGPYAAQVGLAADVVTAIDRMSQWSLASTAARLGKRGAVVAARWAARRRPLVRGSDRAAYLHRAWPSIHRHLAATGAAVPFYVFGHTHYAERRGLPGQNCEYINCGTWSCSGHRGDCASPPPLTFTWIGWEEGANPTAALMRWDDEAATTRQCA